HLPINRSDGFYTCSSGALGYGIPAAIGVALGRPGEKVIGLVGDGSSMYTVQGLWTAAQLQLPITYVIVKNGRYQALEDFGRHFGMMHTAGARLCAIDFVALAKGQGIEATCVDRPEALAGALRAALAGPHPTLVEVVVD